jgi:hypothetical protein
LLLVYLRTLVSLGFKGVSYYTLFGLCYGALDEFVVDALLDKETRTCTTALTLVEEES